MMSLFHKFLLSIMPRNAAYKVSRHPPTVNLLRGNNRKTAIVLVHGFTGSGISTWSDISKEILSDAALSNWDLIALQYSSNLRVDIRRIWSADPSIELLSNYLNTLFSMPPLSNYDRIALIGHSMGGLVIQRAILDDQSLTSRLSHVLLFGTPSAGLVKANFGKFFKRQLRDMGTDSEFIKTLRKDWAKAFPDRPPFSFKVVAGETDEFVPAFSSIGPFQSEYRSVVRGNHLSMLSVNTGDVASYQLLSDLICGGQHRSIADSARLAVELGEFSEAISQLLPNVSDLDESALASLALALETLGDGGRAIEILEQYGRKPTSSTDALGVLAGRIKRRWLVQRSESDLKRALELYAEGLRRAEEKEDFQQAFYHAINVAFLWLISAAPNSADKSHKEMASTALKYCEQSPVDGWQLATRAEAKLILGDLREATKLYKMALKEITSPREIQSMYNQAVRIANCVFNESGIKSVEQVFQRE